MAPKKATTGKSAATDVAGRGVTTCSQDQRRAVMTDAALPNREDMPPPPPPPPPSRGGDLGGAEAGNHGRNGVVEGAAGLSTPPRASTPRPHDGTLSSSPSARWRGERGPWHAVHEPTLDSRAARRPQPQRRADHGEVSTRLPTHSGITVVRGLARTRRCAARVFAVAL